MLSHSSETDGAERSMLDLFDEWTKTTDIEVEFVIRKPVKNLANEMKTRGYRYHTLYYTNWAQRRPSKDLVEQAWYAKQNRRAVDKIMDIIKTLKPDIVMTNTMVAPWAALAAREQSLPHVWFVREYGDADSGFEFLLGKEKTFKIIDKLSDLVVTNSSTLADYLAKYIDRKKLTTLYTPFNLVSLKELSARPVLSPFRDSKSLKLIIVGRIAASKGQADVAEAVGLLAREGLNVELCIVGEPSEPADAASLYEAVKNYDIGERVHFVGRQTNPLSYVAHADVGVMASEKEAFGRTTFEYLALGKPVIGAESGATPEMVITGHNGYLYELGNPAKLAEAIRNYVAKPSLVKLHGEASRKQAVAMMAGTHNAHALYKKIEFLLGTERQNDSVAIDTSWLDEKRYTPGNREITLKTLYVKTRLFLKQAYIWLH